MAISVPIAVDRLLEARATHRPLAPLSDTEGDFGLEHAYIIQDALRAELARRGQRSIGWKLGATSAAGQAVMGVTEPAAGFLLSARYASGADVALKEFTSAGVEAEIAFRMRSRLAGPGITAAAAAAAVEGAVPALELVDFIFSGTPRVGDFVASSVIAKAIVVGERVTPLAGLELPDERVVLEHNGEVVGTYLATEVMGNPLNALAWLANHLAGRGLALMPGDIVMSGSISTLLRPKAGDAVRASYSRLGAVGVRFS